MSVQAAKAQQQKVLQAMLRDEARRKQYQKELAECVIRCYYLLFSILLFIILSLFRYRICEYFYAFLFFTFFLLVLQMGQIEI